MTGPDDDDGADRPDTEGLERSTEKAESATRDPPTPTRPVASDDPAEQPDEWVLLVRDVVTSVSAVFLLGAYLFAISGVWPPMVAIESGSMEPHMDVNDLVFVMDSDRFQPDAAHERTGIVTANSGQETGYTQYEGYGDVIVFEPNGNDQQTPVIHRAMFWVQAGENWCQQADPAYLGGLEERQPRCTAPHDGFITKGDNNMLYDQARSGSPVKPKWVVGTAEARIPRIGWLRLRFQ